MATKEVKFNRKRYCIFCKESLDPDYKDAAFLRRFITERGKIVPRIKSGVCFKHQRSLGKEIKKSRYMALLPFSVSVS